MNRLFVIFNVDQPHLFLRYGMVAIANTMLTLAVIAGAKSLLGFADVPANLAGYSLGVSCSFLLNRRWTFNNRGPMLASSSRFLAAVAVAYMANLLVVLAVLRLSDVAYMAHIFGLPVYSLLLFVLCRRYVFKNVSVAGDRC